MFSAIGLQKLTGEDFGYKPYDNFSERENTITRWQQWLAGHHREG
jgi:hypothetical protein